MRIRGTSLFAEAAARQMRGAPTPAEALLWSYLRQRPRGAKFRRQHAVGHFIFDFVCKSARVVVEVDGSVHDAAKDADAERDAITRSFGYEVLRFSNEDVLGMPDVVARRVAAVVDARLKRRRAP